VTDAQATDWYSRFLLERALAVAYLVALVVAVNQFVPPLGEHGLEPVLRFVSFVAFRGSPSLFYAFLHGTAFRLTWLPRSILHSGVVVNPHRRDRRAVRIIPAAAVCRDGRDPHHSVSADSDRQRESLVAQLTDDRAGDPDALGSLAGVAAGAAALAARADRSAV
jgi:hypothetical protein